MSEALLIELGCEEIPARTLVRQAEMLSDGLRERLLDAGLLDSAAPIRWLATPRRLAVIVEHVSRRQPDRCIERKGPPESAAFDQQGKPTRAAIGFARSVGLELEQLDRLENEQGRWLYAEFDQPGQALAKLLQEMLDSVVRDMAGARSMRWSDRSDRFVRPVRWLLVMHGNQVVPVDLFGIPSGNTTHGHRIHSPGPHKLETVDQYESLLEQAFVLADYQRRRSTIVEQVEDLARKAGLTAGVDSALIDEVTGLVEWPVSVVGSFDAEFLEVPQEALISSMREHQKSFPLFDRDGRLAPGFISVANLESLQPELMIHGFERVIRPRLADARFFYRQDRQQTLVDRLERLDGMLFQEKLGSLADKSARLEALAARLASLFSADPETCSRAARLCKCDLVTEMVGEFPELQGTMGRYYALADGEPESVAAAIENHYLPRHASDALPKDPAGQALATADRLDTLVGVFAAGKKPRGGKDPFALRRAALAVARILEHSRCQATLAELLQQAREVLQSRIAVANEITAELESFILERLRAHLTERGIEANTLHAVSAGAAGPVVDFVAKARAVQAFADNPEMTSLIAANKRAANLLEQASEIDLGEVKEHLLQLEAESTLFTEIQDREKTLEGLLQQREYPAVLEQLATLKPLVDRFFDDVMVMVDDKDLQRNRLSLLYRLRGQFLRVADVARLGRT